jgi:hypothetical protein
MVATYKQTWKNWKLDPEEQRKEKIKQLRSCLKNNGGSYAFSETSKSNMCDIAH